MYFAGIDIGSTMTKVVIMREDIHASVVGPTGAEHRRLAHKVMEEALAQAKLSFDDKKIIENFNTIYKAILAAKPSSLKGNYIKSISLSSSMGAGVKIDLTKIK